MQIKFLMKRVLIYDDDEDILFLSGMILGAYDYSVEVRSRCEDIIHDIELTKPDIILMDLAIPMIGGEKGISLVRDSPSVKNIPVILFSANADIEEICKNTGADGYLKKPFNIEDLRKLIEATLIKVQASS